MLVAIALLAASAATDHATKIQQTVGSATLVRARAQTIKPCACLSSVPCVTPSQAAQAKNYELALSKVDQVLTLAQEWKKALAAAKSDSESPPVPEQAPQPPAESVPFSINSTHVPAKCPRKSVEGATMKVHYVGKLIKTGKIFASSFHTGSQPLRFILGSNDVIAAWKEGLLGMCEGERRRLMVPWDKGYGEKGGKGVPPYSDLQYDFELAELSVPKIPKTKAKAEL